VLLHQEGCQVEMSPTLFRGLSRDNILASLKVVASSGVATPEAAHLVDVGSDAYLDLLEKEFLQASSDTVTSTVRIFEGASGSGKTHLLELLRRKAVAAGYATVRTTLSESLHLEDFKLISRHILENIEGKVNGALVRSLPDLLSRAGAAGRVRTAELESYQAPHPGFKAACHYAAEFPLDHPDFSHLRRFLLGERISGAALSSSGIKYVKNPLSERNAERVIRTVCSVLQFAGFRGLALLFDENERTLVVSRGTPSMRVRKTANLLRRMIDSCVNGEMPRTVVVFTVLPAFLENAKQYLDALGTRTVTVQPIVNGRSASRRVEADLRGREAVLAASRPVCSPVLSWWG